MVVNRRRRPDKDVVTAAQRYFEERWLTVNSAVVGDGERMQRRRGAVDLWPFHGERGRRLKKTLGNTGFGDYDNLNQSGSSETPAQARKLCMIS